MTDQVENINVPQPPKREFWLISMLKAASYIAFYFILMTVVQVIAIIPAGIKYYYGKITMDEYMAEAYATAYPAMIFSAVVTILAFALFMMIRRKSVIKEFSIRRARTSVLVISFATGVLLNFALNFFMSFLPPRVLEDYSSTVEIDAPIWVTILAAVVMAPLVEELIFRGLATSRLARSLPAWSAVLISSFVFGAVHGHWVQMLYAGSLGLVLGMLFVNTDSIFPSILMHFGFNSVSILSFIDFEKLSDAEYFALNSALGALTLIAIPLSAGGIVGLWLLTRKKKDPAALAAASQADSGYANPFADPYARVGSDLSRNPYIITRNEKVSAPEADGEAETSEQTVNESGKEVNEEITENTDKDNLKISPEEQESVKEEE